MIQLRHVPDAIHRKLKARAARKGMSLSDYLVREVTGIAEEPSIEEWMEQIAKRTRIDLREPAAVTVRRLRDSR